MDTERGHSRSAALSKAETHLTDFAVEKYFVFVTYRSQR